MRGFGGAQPGPPRLQIAVQAGIEPIEPAVASVACTSRWRQTEVECDWHACRRSTYP